MNPSNENPTGQWNSYDIVCRRGHITLTVNGLLQNECTRASLEKGCIVLQSEGSPVEFHNFWLEPLK